MKKDGKTNLNPKKPPKIFRNPQKKIENLSFCWPVTIVYSAVPGLSTRWKEPPPLRAFQGFQGQVVG